MHTVILKIKHTKGNNNMKKITSVFLCALMILASFCAAIPAGATPSGTAVRSAEDFAAMSAGGTYYLDADITLTSTYETTFTGTLDGNGHTLTISAPVFKQMNGTVKNLITVGEIKISSSAQIQVGAVANSSKGATFENVVNKANVTVTNTGESPEFDVGGIAGRLNGHSDAPHAAIFTNCTNEGNVTAHGKVGGIVGGSYDGDALFQNCVNRGNISNPSGKKNGFAAGGIYGYNGSAAVKVVNCLNTGNVVSALHAGGIAGDAKKSVTVTNCTNNGNVSLSSTAKSDYDAAAGGIVGFAFDTGCTVTLTIENCVNNGDITGYVAGSSNGRAAGIVGHTDKCGKVQVVVKNCINNGTIKAGAQAGGLLGYIYGSSSTYATIDGCINNGDIYGAQWASEFFSYSNHDSTVIKNSIGTGKLGTINEGKNHYHVIIGLSSGNIENYTIENLFLADGGATKLLSWSTSKENNKVELDETTALGRDYSEKVKSITRGELNAEFIAAANTAVGSELFALRNGKVEFATLSVGADETKIVGVYIADASVTVVEGKTVKVNTFFNPLGASAELEWSVTDTDIATVANGVITGVKAGETTVTVKCGELSDTCSVTVTEYVPMTGLTLDTTTLSVKVGNSATLTATFVPENTTDDTTVIWTSTDDDVATVTNGVVTGVAEGTTVIKATCGDFTAECTVTVKKDSCEHKNTVTEGYHAPNHVKQWAGESGVTTCLDCGEVIGENVKLAPTAHKAGKTYTYDGESHWKVCTYAGCTAEVKNTRGAHTYNETGVCTVCGYGADGTMRGDIDADGTVNSTDAIYLLKHTLFGTSQYPVSQNVDFNKDGKVTSEDAIYLLKYTLFGNTYPLD